MFYMVKILKCDDCGSIVQLLVKGDAKTCSEHMLEFPIQTEGEKAPKHKPVVEIDGNDITVKVGEAAHPMDEDHYIQFILVESDCEHYIKFLEPGDAPEASFTINCTKDLVVLAFCNQHGLWSYE